MNRHLRIFIKNRNKKVTFIRSAKKRIKSIRNKLLEKLEKDMFYGNYYCKPPTGIQ